jgi:hypothetical protein
MKSDGFVPIELKIKTGAQEYENKAPERGEHTIPILG